MGRSPPRGGEARNTPCVWGRGEGLDVRKEEKVGVGRVGGRRWKPAGGGEVGGGWFYALGFRRREGVGLVR